MNATAHAGGLIPVMLTLTSSQIRQMVAIQEAATLPISPSAIVGHLLDSFGPEILRSAIATGDPSVSWQRPDRRHR
jgi:hypothetical protein